MPWIAIFLDFRFHFDLKRIMDWRDEHERIMFIFQTHKWDITMFYYTGVDGGVEKWPRFCFIFLLLVLFVVASVSLHEAYFKAIG